MVDGPLVEGIPALGPGDSRKIAWGQYGGLTKALGGESIVLTYEYKDGGQQARSRTAILECRSFTGTDAVDSEGVRMIKELKKIASAAEKIAGSGSKKNDQEQST